MADYWKSTGKHYCEFCKCWTADNKVSIQFHENGKNHKENVKRRLVEIKKNSIDKRKKDEQSKRMFEKMEKAALAAVQKDINNADVAVGKSDLRSIVKAHAKHEDGNSGVSKTDSSTYPWKTMEGPQGTTYYYNSLTGGTYPLNTIKSSWVVPEVIKKQIEKQKRDYSSPSTTSSSGRDYNKRSAETIKNPTKDPYRAAEPTEAPPEEVRDSHPLLGGWTTVQSYGVDDDDEERATEDEPNINEESNEDQREEEKKEQEVVDTGKRFKQKQIKTSIATSSEEPVAFKKRKFGNRNVRRKRDDDD